MANWKGIVGLSFSQEAFDKYCHSLHWTQWRPSAIVLHNTSTPTLIQRPNGFTAKHIENLVHYYRDDQGWSAGPHLFIDDKQIWVFCPLTLSGVHSPSYNKMALGVEMLGEYSTELFDSDRGLSVQKNTVAALATLYAVLGLNPENLILHKEDPMTSHKDCPGKNVDKTAIIEKVKQLLLERHGGEHFEEADEHP
ncbi:hypothetical protein C3Z09_07200 [Lelliottia aquatilis]|uniref:peptidoglycan recognition protein family protein n=1 Tax=Lelliottia aquatilis TaxID=2080838 RepID=UPI000CDF0358|nr:peptidoglycan recognition family protein [Lelliottia aquatilis]POZ17511.1 hypothetical protein C3Z09_07200 [Lelliottia aquatilis]